ncbi:rmd5 family protein [Plasmopara halstedii]|uniref:Rmd5 family protein n=1 Tax=Plasmopara halstedii TaxID=4781 RepID=A0A0P1AZT3_PLAHL|nr:rmd5 family protein [Plasmopara halstedii]CEG46967.1 rmd5 family protein [Plasmopara halstedii]|eukprot:XP_024583336.1 rmd5 family protein [Plasmopara halstedii]
MQVLEKESDRVLKKQRQCVAYIDQQLDELLSQIGSAKKQLEDRQKELSRKKNGHFASSSMGEGNLVTSSSNATQTLCHFVNVGYEKPLENSRMPCGSASAQNDVAVETQDDETEHIVRDFIRRAKYLNADQNVTNELKAIHVLLSKFSKQIDKSLSTDISKVCRSNEVKQKLVCQLVAEYLYQDGQIEAADAMCKEANLELPPTFRNCFVELHQILKALRIHDMQPALDWARKHRKDLEQLNIDVEFELIRLKYVDILESSADMMDAVNLANKELPYFHHTHTEEVGVLMSCVLFKGKLEESPYKTLFKTNRWEKIQDTVMHAWCCLRRVPFRSYLGICLSTGVSALPAMQKLVSLTDSKLIDWDRMEELPVEIPIPQEFRFHNVFSCPVSKEESTPNNPPILLKCGHVICHSCVKRFSYNMTRRFKCPTCPIEQTEEETLKLFF